MKAFQLSASCVMQAEAMTKEYRLPVLLIEFDRDRAFALQVLQSALPISEAS